MTVNDLVDYQENSSFGFGIHLNGGFFNPSDQSAGSQYQSPFVGDITIGMSGSIKEGITYTVVGEGQILIGDDPDMQILAEVKRDEDGRQVVTVEDEWGFEITIPLVNFNQLAFEAGRIGDFFEALTAPIPSNVAAQGPAAEDYYRRLIANGYGGNNLAAAFEDERVQDFISKQENWNRALARYGFAGAIPDDIKALILSGVEVNYDAQGRPTADIACTVSGAGCYIYVSNSDIDQERAADVARDRILELVEELASGNPGILESIIGTVTGDVTEQILIGHDLEYMLRLYMYCADDFSGFDFLSADQRTLLESRFGRGFEAELIEIRRQSDILDSMEELSAAAVDIFGGHGADKYPEFINFLTVAEQIHSGDPFTTVNESNDLLTYIQQLGGVALQN